jgi:hypothetical protein
MSTSDDQAPRRTSTGILRWPNGDIWIPEPQPTRRTGPFGHATEQEWREHLIAAAAQVRHLDHAARSLAEDLIFQNDHDGLRVPERSQQSQELHDNVVEEFVAAQLYAKDGAAEEAYAQWVASNREAERGGQCIESSRDDTDREFDEWLHGPEQSAGRDEGYGLDI